MTPETAALQFPLSESADVTQVAHLIADATGIVIASVPHARDRKAIIEAVNASSQLRAQVADMNAIWESNQQQLTEAYMEAATLRAHVETLQKQLDEGSFSQATLVYYGHQAVPNSQMKLFAEQAAQVETLQAERREMLSQIFQRTAERDNALHEVGVLREMLNQEREARWPTP